MVHKIDLEGKAKPRGRPFQKGHTIRKTKNAINDTTGHSSGNEGGVVAPALNSEIVEQIRPFSSILQKSVEDTNTTLKECMETPQQENQGGYIDIPAKELSDIIPLALIESMDFTNGENKLSIRFSKKNNRMFRIQIFLNDENEIRPVTYNGSSTAYGFWNLLKKSLKK